MFNCEKSTDEQRTNINEWIECLCYQTSFKFIDLQLSVEYYLSSFIVICSSFIVYFLKSITCVKFLKIFIKITETRVCYELGERVDIEYWLAVTSMLTGK